MRRIITLVGFLLMVAACDDGTGNPQIANEEDKLRLYALNCGHLALNDLAPFGSEGEYDGQPGELAVMCYLIRHPEGDLVWDAGLPDALNALPNGQSNDSGVMTVPMTMVSQLETVGVTPDDIEYFSISHSHFDHVGNAGLFSNSTLLIQSVEREFMFGVGAETGIVTPELVEPLRDVKTVTFEQDYDVFGDGSVVIVPAPGHTPGHSVLFLNLEETGPVYLSGDLYHIARSRPERIVPAFNFSIPQTLETMEVFEARVAEQGARLIIQHSLQDQTLLPRVPDFLD